MIEIQEIKCSSVNEIIDLLLDQKQQPFLIYLPKNTQQGFSTIEDIADDYATITYCGELLNYVSDKFFYSKISAEVHESVMFKIETKRIEELAQVIYNISKGFNNVEEDEDEGMFGDEVQEFLDQIESKEIEPACNYYYQIFLNYLEQVKVSTVEDELH